MWALDGESFRLRKVLEVVMGIVVTSTAAASTVTALPGSMRARLPVLLALIYITLQHTHPMRTRMIPTRIPIEVVVLLCESAAD